jgi:hypothetical protein
MKFKTIDNIKEDGVLNVGVNTLYDISLGVLSNEIKEVFDGFCIDKKNIKDNSAEAPDYKMCRYGAIFLAEILESINPDKWRVEGGATWPPYFKTGGFKTKNGVWEGHYWATNGNIIIDIAVSQFCENEIIITSVSDKRYEANYDKSEIKRDLSDISETIDNWMARTQIKNFKVKQKNLNTKNRFRF